ncbi:uncharacterized protein LAESUDRAFT_738329 [Laetiporus sulphureus 93-53]|uniref:F-box domain-containing protein n=1 Tax=Laetiporus sulphureus 93-53 TaxID=1314785 RepID=A0A165CR76_9APHY|nr:uncharacterized protein LAESUDRAFT_738329 [Laetiporus sulphureus 93-53]KZT03281.1 hypothetical protein LAESUDRAFT_738329 [Laetiporus sulphureus 93-53]
MPSLAKVPPEILEHIAFFAATDPLLGPPAGIIPLLATNRRIHSVLAFDSNPHLWACIFSHKFDVSAAVRRLGRERTSPVAMAEELKERCLLMRRIRERKDTLVSSINVNAEHMHVLSSILWMAYLMMLENDGRNERQLREYARIDEWLKEFLFHQSGASLIQLSVTLDAWPSGDDERTSLAMWLFWMLLRPDDYMTDESTFYHTTSVLKLVALGAHQYSLCTPSWRDFIPPHHLKDVSQTTRYAASLSLVPPAPAAPAILSYLTLINKLPVSWDTISYMKPPEPSVPSVGGTSGSREWEAEWERSVGLAISATPLGPDLSGAFVPGSLEGYWEGLFTYTEFTAYAALLSGASPSVLERSLVAQHPQLWKLREHHLYAEEDDDDLAGPNPRLSEPLTAGSPLRAYIPTGTEVHEVPDGLEVKEPERPLVVYESWAAVRANPEKARKRRRVRDVIITGEGHSAWGQFNLVGRIRPCDGFISLSKDYMNDDRGRWLYRGYIIGNAHGNLSGRWRDTLSPSDVQGYEGCFMMSRRK